MVSGASEWVLVLGASSGFGAAVSIELARRGYDVCGVHLDRRSTVEAADRTRAAIAEAGRRALFFNVNACDGGKREEVMAALEQACPPGRLRLLFHSLAFGTLLPLVGDDARASVRAAQLEMTLDVMANSLVYWSQEAVWRRLMGEGGRILAMTSAGSSRAMLGYGPVSAAKAALEAYVRQLAVELAPRKIAVNAIRAGVTDTAAARKIPAWEALRERAVAANPYHRLTTPADVSVAVSLLVEPGAHWISGNVIGVDGGEDISG